MASNKSEGVMPAVNSAFKMDGEDSFATIIKEGIHNTFVVCIMFPDISPEEAKREIAQALRMLATMSTDVELKDAREEEEDKTDGEQDEGRAEFQYFSSKHGLVQFFKNTTTSKYQAKYTKAKDVVSTQTKPSTTKQRLNEEFQLAFLAATESSNLTLVQRMTFTGIFKTLSDREVYEGFFKDVFEKNQAMFRKLAQVYEKESVRSLCADKASAPAWLEVDEAVERYKADSDELEREETQETKDG